MSRTQNAAAAAAAADAKDVGASKAILPSDAPEG